mmetsp:Transcript_5281/g.15002  ORF Transcript_5281/g.15002 Transcript_5281/m.15002 type:complete len:83 (+) Transcript_5281:54-302(+)
MMLLPLLAVATSLVHVASAFSAIAPTAPATSTGSSILDGLRATPLLRASDSQPIALPSQWRSGTPFGIADEVAVVAFLRHFG